MPIREFVFVWIIYNASIFNMANLWKVKRSVISVYILNQVEQFMPMYEMYLFCLSLLVQVVSYFESREFRFYIKSYKM